MGNQLLLQDMGRRKWLGLAAMVPVAWWLRPGKTIVIRADSNGNFWVKGSADGVPVDWLVDTGASDVTITPSAASQIGLRNLHYSVPHGTANGTVNDAPIQIRSLRVGSLTVENFPAMASRNSEANMLGTSFLSRCYVATGGGFLVLALHH